MAQEAAGIEAKVQLVSDETGESGSDAVSKSKATTEPEASPPSSTPDDAPSEIEEVPDDGVRYRCDGKCGFAGTFAEVATHELTCSVVLEQSAGRGNKGGRRETRYACDGNCGFTGTFYEVVVHEATCPACPRRRAARRRSPIFPLAHCWQSRTTTTSPIVNFCCAIWLICLVAAFVGVMVACSQQTECFSRDRSRGVKSGQGAGLGMV